MHVSARFGLVALASLLLATPSLAQSSGQVAAQPGCPSGMVTRAAAGAVALRAQLKHEATVVDDPAISPRIAMLLARFKDALAETSTAAFRCAGPDVSTSQIEATLADALHANSNAATAAPLETRGNKDIGIFGSDLAVQVFQLFGKPRIFEVDLRYGIECGDDNLLLLFETPSEEAGNVWHATLRWDAGHYATAADALGDFVLLTPLTGNAQRPVWRYLVAHGQPGCAPTPRPSRFSLDLLTPTADPARPTVSWHFEDSYSQGNTIPRLATTEDTIEFRLIPAPAGPETPESKTGNTPTSSEASPRPGQHADGQNSAPMSEKIYRFRLNSSGEVVPASGAPDPTSPDQAPPPDAAPATPQLPT